MQNSIYCHFVYTETFKIIKKTSGSSGHQTLVRTKLVLKPKS